MAWVKVNEHGSEGFIPADPLDPNCMSRGCSCMSRNGESICGNFFGSTHISGQCFVACGSDEEEADAGALPGSTTPSPVTRPATVISTARKFPKAIETRYANCRFRSRLEARWAVFFDAVRLEWEYEKEGFELPGVGRYLPDFWIPAWKVWIEIKGQEPTEKERQRCAALRDATGFAVILIYGNIGNEDKWGYFWSTGEQLGPSCCGLNFGLNCEGKFFFYACTGLPISQAFSDAQCFFPIPTSPLVQKFGPNHDLIKYDIDDMRERFAHAYESARSARFEFGEQG